MHSPSRPLSPDIHMFTNPKFLQVNSDKDSCGEFMSTQFLAKEEKPLTLLVEAKKYVSFHCRTMLLLQGRILFSTNGPQIGVRCMVFNVWFHNHGRAHYDQRSRGCFLRQIPAFYQNKIFLIAGASLLECYCIHPSVKISLVTSLTQPLTLITAYYLQPSNPRSQEYRKL